MASDVYESMKFYYTFQTSLTWNSNFTQQITVSISNDIVSNCTVMPNHESTIYQYWEEPHHYETIFIQCPIKLPPILYQERTSDEVFYTGNCTNEEIQYSYLEIEFFL